MAYTTIDDPEAYFQIELYTGTGSSNARTFDGDTDMQPDLVWIKRRDDDSGHTLLDAVRGGDKQLFTNTTGAEDDNDETVTAFGSDGFTVGTNGGVNGDTRTYVAFCWKESATAGFDIVAYTGDGANRTISHSLSAVPHFFITKKRSDTSSWKVYHQGSASSPEDVSLSLQGTGAVDDDATYYNDTAPTSSVFSLGTNEDLNADSATFVAYLWTGIQGFSKFGSYTGNGNADGPFIYTGFAPAFVLWKAYNGSLNWIIEDSKRNIAGLGYLNGANSEELYPNVGTAETQAGGRFDFLSNGLKVRDSSSADINGSNSFIYAAFAEAPFVNSNGVPCNAK